MSTIDRRRLANLVMVLVFAVAASGGCARRPAGPATPAGPASPAATPGAAPQQPGGTQAAETGGFPLTLTDGMGREIEIRSKPSRIVSIAPSATEILFGLGAGDRIVGVTTFCDYPEEAKQKEKIGDYSNPSIEKIASLKPDLVVGDFVHKEVATSLARLGIPSLLLESLSVSEAIEAQRLVGKAIGEAGAGEVVAARMESRVEEVRRKVEGPPGSSRPSVFHEMWHEPILTSGPGTIMDDLIRLAGGVNVAADAKTLYPEYSLEALIAKNPDIIIYTEHADTRRFQVKGWSSLKAVKQGRVYRLTDDLVSRPGPRIVDGLEELARALHPESFKQ